MNNSPVGERAMGVKVAEAGFQSMGDLLASLGGVSPDRVRWSPRPGTATVRDVARLRDESKRLCELVNGTLVEKTVGAKESFVAARLITLLNTHSDANGDSGMVLGADGMMELMPDLVRIPDASFTSWDRVPGRVVPDEPVPELVPDLAAEVLSESNTREEMRQKLEHYFEAGVKLVWYIDPRTQTVRVFTSRDDVTELSAADTLDGGAVLPGFAVEVARLFDRVAPAPAKPAKPNGKKPKKRK